MSFLFLISACAGTRGSPTNRRNTIKAKWLAMSAEHLGKFIALQFIQSLSLMRHRFWSPPRFQTQNARMLVEWLLFHRSSWSAGIVARFAWRQALTALFRLAKKQVSRESLKVGHWHQVLGASRFLRPSRLPASRPPP